MDADVSRSLKARAVRLESLTLGWMAVEAAVAVVSGILARSIALVGFGLDSLAEMFAASVVLWEIRGAGTESGERRALRLIALSYFVLAAYVGAESVRDLAAGRHPQHSYPGIAMAAAALVVMPLLALAKRRTAAAMGSATLAAESGESKICAYLAAGLLAGLVVNAALGWWWADPGAALIVAAVAVREGREAWRGDRCC